jgi:integrase
MPRIKLAPGEHSEPEANPYRIDPDDPAGKRKIKADSARQATHWRARCQVRAIDGTRYDLTRWAKTKRAALDAIGEALADRERSSVDGSLKPSTPFVDAGRAWLEQQRRPEAGKSVRTLEAYRGAFHRYLDADGCALRGLTLAQANSVPRVLTLLQHVADEHGSGAAKMARTVLSGIFGSGVKLGVLEMNSARQTGAVKAMEARKSKRNHRRSLTPDERANAIEAADLLAAKSGADPRTARKWQTVADLVAFLAGTGVRISEARMLRWEQVNLKAGTVEIHGTKTAASLRGLNMPDWLTARMKRRARAGRKGYVFPSPALLEGHDQPTDSANLQKWVRVVLDNAGLDWATSHSFRRTVATMLHQGGAPLVRIADQLGHANPTMTANVYLGRDLRGNKADLAAML